jgi:hypothetical protein
MNIETSKLIDKALDWAVAKCKGTLGHYVQPNEKRGTVKWKITPSTRRYSTNWMQGGPIIEREGIAMSSTPDGLWAAYAHAGTRLVQHGGQAVEVFNWTYKQQGHSPLIAAMRCYVSSKLGDIVEIPDELITQ